MFIDVVNVGWVPIYNTNLSEDVPGYMGAPAIALSCPWTHFICGHLGRLATRDDVAVHQAGQAPAQAWRLVIFRCRGNLARGHRRATW
jgi:hypothetical protein